MTWLTYSVPTVPMPELAPPGGSIIELFLPVQAGIPLDCLGQGGGPRGVRQSKPSKRSRASTLCRLRRCAL